MTPAPKYKPGDRVVTRMYGPGVIETLARTTAMVQLDRGRTGNPVRLRLEEIRHETAEDVAKRDHKAAMAAWLARKPDSKHAEIAWSMQWGGGNNPEGANVYLAKTPADMRAAAAELLLLADWFAERPVEK